MHHRAVRLHRPKVDHDLVRLLVEGGGGFEAADVGAVAELGLAVATSVVQHTSTVVAQ